MREAATKVLEMRPVIPIKAVADLRTHVAQRERGVHGFLAPFGVGGGDLVAPVVAGAEVVFELAAEHGRDGLVFGEDGVFAVAGLD